MRDFVLPKEASSDVREAFRQLRLIVRELQAGVREQPVTEAPTERTVPTRQTGGIPEIARGRTQQQETQQQSLPFSSEI